MPSLSLDITVDHGTFHIHAQDFGPRYDSTGQFWFKVIRTIAEICFRSSDMCRVWNRIFPPFRQAVHACRANSALRLCQVSSEWGNGPLERIFSAKLDQALSAKTKFAEHRRSRIEFNFRTKR